MAGFVNGLAWTIIIIFVVTLAVSVTVAIDASIIAIGHYVDGP